MAGPWTPQPFEADDGTVPFERFAGGLSDFQFVALDAAIRNVLQARGIDLVGTEWLKPLGQGLHEFRVRHDAAEITHMFGDGGSGPGEEATSPAASRPRREKVLLRVFVHFYGDMEVLLLGGYDKGADPKARRQQQAIARARQGLGQFKERQRRERSIERKRRDPQS